MKKRIVQTIHAHFPIILLLAALLFAGVVSAVSTAEVAPDLATSQAIGRTFDNQNSPVYQFSERAVGIEFRPAYDPSGRAVGIEFDPPNGSSINAVGIEFDPPPGNALDVEFQSQE